MKIIHSFKNRKAEKMVEQDTSFLLTNKKGGYCYLSGKPESRYQGVFFNKDFRMYKVIDNIKTGGEVEELANNFSEVRRKKGNLTETFFMPYGFNSLVYELDKESDAEIVLDIRESYSSPEFGRIYDIYEEDGRIIVKYRQEGEFECFLIISGHKSYEQICKWIKQEHELDRKRNSPPFEKHVFSALKVKCSKLVFSFSFNKEEAVKENKQVYEDTAKLKIVQAKQIEHLFNRNESQLKKIKDKEAQIAYLCALNSLNNLFVETSGHEGVFAGLPWFFQFWARDEAVCIKALSKIASINKIILRAISNINNNLSRYQKGEMISADFPGWIIKRIHELDKKMLNEEEVRRVFEKLDDGLSFNGAKQTWMDTIDRIGARIEINALKLAIIESSKKQELEDRFRFKVMEAFWNGSYLMDGSSDSAIRPNIFIAAYIYPELLKREEWVDCFKKVLPRLTVGWGGIITIDKESPLFHSEHTGEDSKSYHNGDSWFWINNLSAISLYRVDKKNFKTQIKKIIKSSVTEILWKGAIGCHSELSSASELKSEGCISQAWSAAMFIELIDELDDGFL